MREPVKHSRGEWYFSHTLAGMALFMMLVCVAVNIYFEVAGTEEINFPTVFAWILGISTFGMLWFWIRMISDFLGERPARHPVGWGWALLLGFVLGALPYFWLIWRPRHRPS